MVTWFHAEKANSDIYGFSRRRPWKSAEHEPHVNTGHNASRTPSANWHLLAPIRTHKHTHSAHIPAHLSPVKAAHAKHTYRELGC